MIDPARRPKWPGSVRRIDAAAGLVTETGARIATELVTSILLLPRRDQAGTPIILSQAR
jgi:hypothetical protein